MESIEVIISASSHPELYFACHHPLYVVVHHGRSSSLVVVRRRPSSIIYRLSLFVVYVIYLGLVEIVVAR